MKTEIGKVTESIAEVYHAQRKNPTENDGSILLLLHSFSLGTEAHMFCMPPTKKSDKISS